MRLALAAALVVGVLPTDPRPAPDDIDRRAGQVEAQVIAWRRDIHQHPELGNREFRTSALVAAHLKALGLEVRTGVGHTGVIGILHGGKPGRVVALRADMDALPVTEPAGLAFASTERAQYNGQDVGVMHACGHDTHTAMLMGVAQVLSGMKASLPGTVVFIFQPAEEGAPEGEMGGANLMLKEGAFDGPTPNVVFGLHVTPGPLGAIFYRAGATMASSDKIKITVHGKQTHGGMPWGGVDPIVASAAIITGLQTIVSRETDLTNGAAVVSIGSIQGGVRNNIIPDSVVMLGTIRTFDSTARRQTRERVQHLAESVAASEGATAVVQIDSQYPVLVNNPALVARMLPSLRRTVGDANVIEGKPVTGSEDFSYYANRVPGFFFFLGVTPPDQDWHTAPKNHSPLFFADERALVVGVRALSHEAVDYLNGPAELAARD
jgi:amidohydrolase